MPKKRRPARKPAHNRQAGARSERGGSRPGRPGKPSVPRAAGATSLGAHTGGAGSGHGAGPAPQGVVPAGSPLRRRVERASVGPLARLSALPRWVPPVLIGLLLVLGLVLPAVPAAVAVLLVLAFVGWLSYLSWPALRGNERLARVAVLVLLVVFLAIQVRT